MIKEKLGIQKINRNIKLYNDKDTKIYDVVYNPQETKLIKEAKANRLDYVTGLSMFLGQAQESFKIWFNINPKINDYLKKRIKIKIKNS